MFNVVADENDYSEKILVCCPCSKILLRKNLKQYLRQDFKSFPGYLCQQFHRPCSSRALKLCLHAVNNDFSFSGGSILLRLFCPIECILLVQFEFFFMNGGKSEEVRSCV